MIGQAKRGKQEKWQYAMHLGTAAALYVAFATKAPAHARGASLAVRSLSGKLDLFFFNVRERFLFGGQQLTKKSLENMIGGVGWGQSVSSDPCMDWGPWGPAHVHLMLNCCDAFCVFKICRETS